MKNPINRYHEPQELTWFFLHRLKRQQTLYRLGFRKARQSWLGFYMGFVTCLVIGFYATCIALTVNLN